MANKIYKFSIGVAIFCMIEDALLITPDPFGNESPTGNDSFLYQIYLYIGGNIPNANMICWFFMALLALSALTAIIFYPLKTKSIFNAILIKLLLSVGILVLLLLYEIVLAILSFWTQGMKGMF